MSYYVDLFQKSIANDCEKPAQEDKSVKKDIPKVDMVLTFLIISKDNIKARKR